MVTVGYADSTTIPTVTVANNFFYWNNPLSGMVACGLSFEQSHTCSYLVYNNVFSLNTSGMGGTGVESDYGNDYTISLRYYNNTIFNTYHDPLSGGASCFNIGFLNGNNIDTLIMKNNVFTSNDNIFYFWEDGATNSITNVTYIDIDYNRYYSRDPLQTFFYDAVKGYKSFSYWQGLGYDVHSSESSIKFKNEYGSNILDYSIVGGSENGISLAPLFWTDILGKVRTSWKEGALEQ